MPVTRVLDSEGNMIHDCTEIGCTVSWDGYALVDTLEIPEHVDARGNKTPASTIHKGTQVPGAGKIPAAYKQLDDSTVQLRSREELVGP